jgi:hypothetical protein
VKATPQEHSFHERVLAGDPVAFSQLCEWLYADLVREVGLRAYGRNHSGATVDMALVEEAVGQALLDYSDRPDRYDPAQAPLRAYLGMAAYGDYRNATSKERRHTSRQATLTGDSLTEVEIADDRQELEGLLARISAREWWPHVEEAISDPVDRQVLLMVMNGVRSTESFARVLGIGGLPAGEQARQVKKAKDRIAKRLRRLGEAYDQQL